MLVAIVAVALVVIAIALLPGRAAAQATSFSATLSGDAEVPPVTTGAGGSFSATLSGGTLSYTLTSDATGITQAHIHLGAADATGGVVAFLFGSVDPGVDGIDVSGSISAGDVIGDIAGDFDALVAALNSGNAYVNVHTEMYPGGEVRGQIAAAAAQATSFSTTLSGGAEVPPVTTAAGGSFSATLSDGTLSYTLTSDATGITQSHIHLGAADANGGVVAFLFGSVDPGVDGIDVSGSISAGDVIGDIAGDFDALIAALNDGNAYVNVHTEMYPGGEVRGQIAAAIEEPADPVAVVEAFVAAMNSGDVDAAVALFAEDGVIDLPNKTFAGLTEIRGDLQETVDNGVNITIVSVEVSGSSVTTTQEIRNPQIEAFGIDRIIRIATFEVRDGKIVSLAQMPDTSDPDTLRFQQAQMAAGGGPPGGPPAGAPPPPSAPDALPATGSGGLANGNGDSGWVALSLAAGLALFVVLGSVTARIAIRRRR